MKQVSLQQFQIDFIEEKANSLVHSFDWAGYEYKAKKADHNSGQIIVEITYWFTAITKYTKEYIVPRRQLEDKKKEYAKCGRCVGLFEKRQSNHKLCNKCSNKKPLVKHVCKFCNTVFYRTKKYAASCGDPICIRKKKNENSRKFLKKQKGTHQIVSVDWK